MKTLRPWQPCLVCPKTMLDSWQSHVCAFAPDVTPTRCNNMKDVFEKFRPSFSAELESVEGEQVNADFQIKAMKDFGSKELIEKNDYLQKVYYGKEILNDLEKQLKKNNALKKTLSDKEKKEALLKLARYYIDLLSEE